MAALGRLLSQSQSIWTDFWMTVQLSDLISEHNINVFISHSTLRCLTEEPVFGYIRVASIKLQRWHSASHGHRDRDLCFHWHFRFQIFCRALKVTTTFYKTTTHKDLELLGQLNTICISSLRKKEPLDIYINSCLQAFPFLCNALVADQIHDSYYYRVT